MSLIQLIDCFQDYYKQWKKADGTYLSQEISSYLHGHSGALTIDKIFFQMDEKQIVIYNYTERNFAGRRGVRLRSTNGTCVHQGA